MWIESCLATIRTLPKTSALLSVALLLLCALPLTRPAVASGFKNVLILHSYHPGLPWTDSIRTGMREVFAASEEVRLHIEYMDTQRYPGSEYVTHVLAALFHYKLKGQKFDLILLSDNPALEFVLEHRDDLFLGTPIVFCGINNFSPAMVAGLSDVTGIAEFPSYRETIAAALRLHPETTEIVVIGGFANVTSRENRKMLSAVLADLPFAVRFSFWDDVPVESLVARLPNLPSGSLVLINGSVVSGAGEVLPFNEEIRLLRAASSRPIYSFWDFFLGEGIVGGKLVSGREQGRAAAGLALRVLQGEDPDAIPVVVENNRFMFDHTELKRFPRSVERLPPDSIVINAPFPYSLSRGGLWSLIGVLTALILILSVAVVLLRRAQLAVRREKERVDLLLASTAEAIYGVDAEGRCTFCNPASLRLLGYGHERELLGKQIHPMIHHSHADGSPYPAAECPMLQVLRSNVLVHGEDELLWRADGTRFPAEYWSHPIRQGDATIGALVTFLDISERRRAEEERERASRELDAFVYTVSHDLRSPLAAVIGFAEFLQGHEEAQLDENARVALAEMQKQGERMSDMMEDLLALARVGKLPRPAEGVDAGAVVQEVLSDLAGEIAAAGLAIRTGALPAVRVPRTFLSEIFSNLIGNAARYAGPAGGPIEVGGTRVKRKVRFFVRDHGPGIPPHERDRIFEVFFRGSTGERISGTGIGLATVRKIAQFYGGDARVEETPGGGATFWVEIADPLR